MSDWNLPPGVSIGDPHISGWDDEGDDCPSEEQLMHWNEANDYTREGEEHEENAVAPWPACPCGEESMSGEMDMRSGIMRWRCAAHTPEALGENLSDDALLWRIASDAYASSRHNGIKRAITDTLSILEDSAASPASGEEGDAARQARQFLAYWFEVWQRERKAARHG